ncbi:acyl carrier protein [Streptomyces stramineus]
MDHAQLDHHRRLDEYGMDSLMGAELLLSLRQRFGVEIPRWNCCAATAPSQTSPRSSTCASAWASRPRKPLPHRPRALPPTTPSYPNSRLPRKPRKPLSNDNGTTGHRQPMTGWRTRILTYAARDCWD